MNFLIFNRFISLLSFSSLIYLFVYSFEYNTLAWLIGSILYYKLIVATFGNQISQHRYFSHNSFQTTKIKKTFLYFISITTGINPFDYAIPHRHHHIHSDTDKDFHSWKNSIWDIFSPLTGISTYTGPVKISRVLDKDLQKYYKWHKHIVLSTIVLLGLISWKVCVFLFLSGIAWNYIHMILFRVWLVHVKLPGGYQNFDCKDNSWNNKFIQLLDIGEGLHNNHHAYPNRYNQATHPGEFDPVGWIVKKFFATDTK